jgi:hypothetical protein
MNFKNLVFALVFCISYGGVLAQGVISNDQRSFAIDYLSQTQADFLKSIDGLTEMQLKFKADTSAWTIMECAEHVVLAEIGLASLIKGQLNTPADSSKRKDIKVTDQEIIRRLTNRQFKAKSPEVILPSGKFPNIQSIRTAFENERKKNVEYVRVSTDDLLNHFWQHPATGTIDLYQSYLLLAAHCKRHTLQIEEIKANPNFPRK